MLKKIFIKIKVCKSRIAFTDQNFIIFIITFKIYFKFIICSE